MSINPEDPSGHKSAKNFCFLSILAGISDICLCIGIYKLIIHLIGG